MPRVDPPRPGPAPRARRSLPGWLALFGLVAVVPTVVLLVTNALEQRRITRLGVQEDLVRLVRLATLHEHTLVETTLGLLRTLARLPELQGSDPQACAEGLRRLTGPLSHYTAFTVHSPQGKFLCGTVTPAGPVDLSDRPYFRQAVSSLRPTVGTYVLGRVSGKGTITFAQPVLDKAGGLRSVLVAGLGLTWLDDLLAPRLLPEGAAVTILDLEGRVLSRRPDGNLVGTRWPDHPLTREIFARQSGGIEVEGFDGVERIYAFAPFRGRGPPAAHLAVGVPTAVAYADIDRLLVRNLAWAAAVALAALSAAWALGRRVILEPIQALVRASGCLGKGDLTARSGLGDLGGEVGQLARAFDHMADDLQRREENLQAAQRVGLLGTWERDLAEDRARWSPEFCQLLGLAPDRPPPSLDGYLDLVHPDDRPAVRAAIAEAAQGLRPLDLEYRILRPDGSVRVLHDRGRVEPTPPGTPPRRWWGIAQDVTDRCDAEAARVKAEERLREAERMEAVGRLAGGVAHDFNNLLTVINATCELRLASLPPGDRLRQSFDEILQAGERAAGLTRQLLAFSRRQVLQPRVLSLNQVVADTESMLRRLAGEDVALWTRLAPDLPPVRADAGQLAQILLNLTANARDAMPGGGTLVVATAMAEVGADRAGPPELPPGRYAVLTVADTGVGMSPETRARIFEPFFTTKEVGQGTGLGLATVHGIAAQSGGTVDVETEPGRGSTFRVYLPSARREDEAPDPEEPPPPLAPGNETVLVAEDEHRVRSVIRRILTGSGYRVLDAATPAEALVLSRSHPGPVELLLTDVVMPGLNGRELADCVVSARPGLRVLYISGHTEDEVVRRGVVEGAAAFLPKPFSGDALLRKVREVLDAPVS